MIDLYVARGVSDDSNREVWRNEGKQDSFDLLRAYFSHAMFDALLFSDLGVLFILLYKIFIIFVFKFIEYLVDGKRRIKLLRYFFFEI